MDIFYTGDIPAQYHYALFNNGYVDLYDTDVLHNNNYTFYRVYTNVGGGFYYRQMTTSVGQYTTTYTQNIQTSDNVVYRQDFFNICFLTILFTLVGIWLLNVITSIFRKGGVFGGLL